MKNTSTDVRENNYVAPTPPSYVFSSEGTGGGRDEKDDGFFAGILLGSIIGSSF